MNKYNRWKEIEYVLGQSIYEHELVKGDQHLIAAIGHAQNIDMIVGLLNHKYKKLHGRKRFLPGGKRKPLRIAITQHVIDTLNDYKPRPNEQ